MGAFTPDRITLSDANGLSKKILAPLLTKVSKKFKLAGSARRKKSDMGDLDFIMADADLSRLKDEIGNVLPIVSVPRSGKSLLTVVAGWKGKNVQIEFTNVPMNSFGAAKIHATGSGKFNIGLRTYAKQKGFTLNQYGLIKKDTGANIASQTEEEIFAALGLKFIPPENREDFWRVKSKYKNTGG